MEAATHLDPCKRGLAAWRAADRWLDAGALFQAATSLAAAGSVAIVTGFPVLTLHGVAAETDGPPGALYLANVLERMGVETTLIGDAIGAPVLAAGLERCGLAKIEVLEFPFEPGSPHEPPRANNDPDCNTASNAWAADYLASPAGRRLTHLVAIERPGPSHTPESLANQPRLGKPPLEQFLSTVPPESRNVCLNMRGLSINGYVAKTHRLFEMVARDRPDVVTIGLADGGNELGAGSLPWEVVARAVACDAGARAACRIATTHLLLAGVSNWAAYALGAAIACVRGEGGLLEGLGVEEQAEVIQTLVRAGAVDGVTSRSEPTVDGLGLPAYLGVLQSVHEIAAGWFSLRAR